MGGGVWLGGSVSRVCGCGCVRGWPLLTVFGGVLFRGYVYVRLYVVGMRRLGGGVVVFVDRLVLTTCLHKTRATTREVFTVDSATLLHPTSLPKDHCEGC